MRLAILHPVPAPYREKLFTTLAETSGINLKVYYCGTGQNYRDWRFVPGNYDREILPGCIFRKNFFFNPRLIQRLRRDRPDFLLVWGWSDPTAILAFLAARLMKISLFMATDSAFPILQRGKNPQSRMIGIIKRCLVRMPQVFLAQGKSAQDYLLSLGASPERIKKVPLNCLEMKDWQLQAAIARSGARQIKAELGIQEKRLILYVGRLVHGKGLETLLEAYAGLNRHLEGVGLLLVGDGPLKEVIESRCRILGLSKVFFHGSQPYEKLPKYYGISDCLVLPTYSDQWPLVVLEALACGLPVVTTERCGSVPDLITGHDTGLVVKHRDSESLAEALSEILTLPANTLAELRKRAYNAAAAYDVKQTAAKLIQVLQLQQNCKVDDKD
jgi:glycosyltransferase involved in cell wall biosynthesis